MPESGDIKVGLVGAAGRGGTFREAFELNGARIHAVCDINEASLDRCLAATGAAEKYTNYEAMLDQSNLDAVVIGTPQQLHAPQAILALQRNLHVLSEVPAAVSVEQAQALVHACRESTGVYMMAENYIYTRSNTLIRELVRRGLFGDPYYAEGEYLHELKGLAEQTIWRRHWQMGIDGNTYPTHSLGPVLQWMPGDRVTRVSCEGSGCRHLDPRGVPYHQDTSVMLCKTEKDALIKLRLDLVSERPHAMNIYQLQGTNGVYESTRAPGEPDRIWLRVLSDEPRWQNLSTLAEPGRPLEQYLPESWRNSSDAAQRAGHGGGDYFEVLDFLSAVRRTSATPIGIHEAMDMTLPGLMSQQSIAQNGAWLDVPDSRHWEKPVQQRRQLHMIWPERLLDSSPAVRLPADYRLRSFRESDTAAYIELMAGAGFTGWTPERVQALFRNVLPGGFFIIEHMPTGGLVATAVATHHPDELHPSGGELGWVSGDPAHRGKGLGTAVCAAVVRRFLEAGYRRIYLRTDDWRLPAIHIYLKLGFEPLHYCEGMAERWDAIMRALQPG